VSRSAKKKKKGAAVGSGFGALRELRDTLKKQETSAPPERPVPPPTRPNPIPKRAEDDLSLLRRAYTGVEPLDRSKGPRARNPLEPSPARRPKATDEGPPALNDDAVVHERLRILALGQTPFEVSDDGERVEGRRTDVPIALLRNLRRGHFPVDARLDLHGMVASDAHARLALFLRTMRERRERAVLVIHGKGDHSPMGLGVLRGEISAWLSQGASSEHVAAFATARSGDGGSGAVYVLLRR
jgi:DNA-nicking Smr family endonuclease